MGVQTSTFLLIRPMIAVNVLPLGVSIIHNIALVIFLLLLTYILLLIVRIKIKNRKLQQELDIRKDIEILFRKSEEEKTLILNNINETILFVDNEHTVLWANQSNQMNVETDVSSIIGKKCHKVFFNSKEVCKFCTYPTTTETIYNEHFVPDKNVYLGCHITPVFNENGSRKGFVKAVVDITDKKQTEKALLKAKKKAEESEKLKSAFLANMSHEIRTPMNAIIGFSELLNDSDISEAERKDYISIIQSNGNQLLKLISDILTSSQLESNQLKIFKKEFDLIELLNGVLTQFIEERKRLDKEHIDFIFDNQTKNGLIIIYSDPERLKQVIYNLMTNALKFTTKGSITLGVEMKKSKIRISVADTGCGIHPEKLKKIFHRFSQADDTSTKKIEGAGLGLTISKEIVSLLGGKLNVKSEMGRGSQFWIDFPVKTTKLK